MIADIFIEGDSMLEMGWIRESIDFPIPKAQTETLVVPGRNTPIRFNEALGRIAYEPRAFTIVLTMLGTRQAFNEKVRLMGNRYQGRLLRVVCSEEPSLYVLGSLNLTPEYDPLTGKGSITIECDDADSYRYHTQETVVTITGSDEAVLNNDYMPVVPVVTTTEETRLVWSVGTDTFNKTLSAGTWEIPELELSQGENTITVTGEGETTFRYREGCL